MKEENLKTMKKGYKNAIAELQVAQERITVLEEKHDAYETRTREIETEIQTATADLVAIRVRVVEGTLDEQVADNSETTLDKLKKELQKIGELQKTTAGILEDTRASISKLKQDIINQRHKMGQQLQEVLTEKIKSASGEDVKELWGIASISGGGSYEELLLRRLFPMASLDGEMQKYQERARMMLEIE